MTPELQTIFDPQELIPSDANGLSVTRHPAHSAHITTTTTMTNMTSAGPPM